MNVTSHRFHERPAPRLSHTLIDERLHQLLWLGAAALVGFLVPYVFADRLNVPRDAYYAIYIASVGVFFFMWTRTSGFSLYGAADGLLLGAFPALAVFAAFPFIRGRAHIPRTVATGALAILAALCVTAAYHLGYPDFRGSKVTAPLRGSVIWTAPTLLSLNPVGSVIAHVGLHVTAVVHTYEGDTFLPPHAAPSGSPGRQAADTRR